jgi:hypothetical protein
LACRCCCRSGCCTSGSHGGRQRAHSTSQSYAHKRARFVDKRPAVAMKVAPGTDTRGQYSSWGAKTELALGLFLGPVFGPIFGPLRPCPIDITQALRRRHQKLAPKSDLKLGPRKEPKSGIPRRPLRAPPESESRRCSDHGAREGASPSHPATTNPTSFTGLDFSQSAQSTRSAKIINSPYQSIHATPFKPMPRVSGMSTSWPASHPPPSFPAPSHPAQISSLTKAS